MSENESIDIKKFLSGLIDPKNAAKTTIFSFHGLLIFLLLFGAYSVFTKFFPSKPKQTQKQTSTVTFQKDSGVGSVTIVNKQDQDENKKNVGIEIAVSTEDIEPSLVKYFNNHASMGIGARWRFETKNNEDKVIPIIKARWDF
jgi:hypothetical protein